MFSPYFRMPPEGKKILMRSFFWSAIIECIFFCITDLLRSECEKKCKKLRSGRCRINHFTMENYTNPELQYFAFTLFQEHKSHMLLHFEFHCKSYFGDDYRVDQGYARNYFAKYPHKFSWKYLHDHQQLLNEFMEIEYLGIEADFGSVLKWLKHMEPVFLPGNVHDLLDLHTEDITLACTHPPGLMMTG